MKPVHPPGESETPRVPGRPEVCGPAGRRIPRRLVLRGAAGAVAAAGAAALAACSTRASGAAGASAGAPAGSSALPTSTNPRTTIVFYAKPPNASTRQSTLVGIMQEVLAPYYAQHPGIDIHLIPSELPDQTIITGIVADQQMDIIYSNYFAPYYQQQLVLPLETYFKSDQVDPTIWNPAQYALYDTAHGPMGVPVYTGTTAYAVNQNVFDELGLAYPAPSWTYQEFVTAAASATRKGAQGGSGADIFWYQNGPNQQASWVFKAFGGNQVSKTGAPSQLTAPTDLAALRWLYQDLFWPKICRSNYGNTGLFVSGRLGLMTIATWDLLSFAEALRGPSVKFEFVPNPVFPSGRATFCTADFYAIAANTRHASACWDLLRWVSVEPTWQQATFSYALRSPALNSLWDQWATTIQTVVPFFKGKDFSWFGDAASKGYAYPVEYYPAADLSVWGLIGPYFSRLLSRNIPSVQQAAAQIDQVVNGFEATSVRQAASRAQIAKEYPTTGGEIASLPAGI